MTSEVNGKIGSGRALRGFFVALVAGWLVLGAAAWLYARSHHVPPRIAVPLAFAFLTEFSFYLLPGFAQAREWLLRRFTRTQLAAAVAASALLPYLIYAIPLGAFGIGQGITFAALAASLAFCFVPQLPSRRIEALRDVLFLALLAAAILSGVLRWIFPAPFPKLPAEVLGHISLVRTAILAALLLRGVKGIGFGFVPHFKDLGVGALWFVICASLAYPTGILLGQLRFSAAKPGVLQSVGLILGVFWVLALSEEFFFRGLLQQWLIRWLGSRAGGLIVASLLFGACHLGFRHAFPNWRFSILATILGLSCGAAFLQARTIRASMVTHALAVGAWRLFLS